MMNSNKSNSDVARTFPKFVDDGAVHLYTLNWHPNYIEILDNG